jgi:hypothetical protein
MTHRPEDPFATDDEGRTDDDDLFGREGRGERRRRPAVGDFVRKAIETMGSVSSSGSVGREALDYLLRQGDRGRRELFRIVAHEVGDFLRNVDVSGEVVKVLSSLQVEFSATLRFRPTDDGKSVDASDSEAKVTVGLADKEKPPEPSPKEQKPVSGAARPSETTPRPSVAPPSEPAREE